MSRRLILVDNASIRHSVDDWHRSIIGFDSLGVIAALDGSIYFLDVSAHHRSKRCIVSTTYFTLSCALAGLWRISQLELLIALDLLI